jgi:hypothetical protein
VERISPIPVISAIGPRDWPYGAGVALADGEEGAVGVAVGAAVGDVAAVADADADPLGDGLAMGLGLGLGDGKMVLGTFRNESAKISTKITITITTQIRAMLSSRGGSEPR